MNSHSVAVTEQNTQLAEENITKRTGEENNRSTLLKRCP